MGYILNGVYYDTRKPHIKELDDYVESFLNDEFSNHEFHCFEGQVYLVVNDQVRHPLPLFIKFSCDKVGRQFPNVRESVAKAVVDGVKEKLEWRKKNNISSQ